MLQGGCFCGRIRYEVTGTPFNETNCHCSICRRDDGRAIRRVVQRAAVGVSRGVRRTRAFPVERESHPQLLCPLRHPADVSRRRLARRGRRHDLQPRSSGAGAADRPHPHEQQAALDPFVRRPAAASGGAAGQVVHGGRGRAIHRPEKCNCIATVVLYTSQYTSLRLERPASARPGIEESAPPVRKIAPKWT